MSVIAATPGTLRVVVIGAGMSGILTGIRLRAAGIDDFVIFMRDIALSGVGGLTLQQAWADATEAHRCLTLPGFPNFFALVGPNSPIGNFSLILIVERQLDYVLQLLELVESGRCRAVMPKASAAAAFNAESATAMGRTVWVSGCRSWYLDQRGRPVTWPWSFERFEQDMRAPQLDEYELIA